jgi:hypothetical protein
MLLWEGFFGSLHVKHTNSLLPDHQYALNVALQDYEDYPRRLHYPCGLGSKKIT